MPLEAVHYYLPAFLLHCLIPSHSVFVLQSMILYLDRRSTPEYPPFSRPQRLCIIEWLDFVRNNIDTFDFEPWRERYERRLRVIRDQWAAA
jgi:hypothetical protein